MKRRKFLSYAAAAPAAAYAGVACTEKKTGEQATSGTHDLVLRNGRILDGSGNPRFKADIALKNGRISKIGRVDEEADRIIDVKGLFVSPGFIDKRGKWQPYRNPQDNEHIVDGLRKAGWEG